MTTRQLLQWHFYRSLGALVGVLALTVMITAAVAPRHLYTRWPLLLLPPALAWASSCRRVLVTRCVHCQHAMGWRGTYLWMLPARLAPACPQCRTSIDAESLDQAAAVTM